LLSTRDDSEVSEWKQKRYHLVPHHKAGSEMCREAAAKMNGAMNLSRDLYPQLMHDGPHEDNLIQYSAFTMGYALDESYMQTPWPACFVQEGRNPFEMVVSGYKYHMAAAEPWCKTSFKDALQNTSGCQQTFVNGRMVPSCGAWPKHWPLKNAYEGLQKLYDSSRYGALAPRLPDIRLTESYSQYLSRLSVEDGLLAEAVFASHMSLEKMRWTYEWTAKQPCSTNVCYNDFFEDCHGTWERVMQVWCIPSPENSIMQDAAAESCPTTSASAKKHSGESQLSTGRHSNSTDLPSSEMVKLVKDLDQELLNGEIADIDRRINCPLSPGYRDEA
jgi:hypothetical protein